MYHLCISSSCEFQYAQIRPVRLYHWIQDAKTVPFGVKTRLFDEIEQSHFHYLIHFSALVYNDASTAYSLDAAV